jgi:hypothetical protein
VSAHPVAWRKEHGAAREHEREERNSNACAFLSAMLGSGVKRHRTILVDLGDSAFSLLCFPVRSISAQQ